MKDDAAKEKVFLDLKDDPRTTALAGDFLQRNPSVSGEVCPTTLTICSRFRVRGNDGIYRRCSD